MTKAGYIAVVGRPNVGKSTLINHLLGQKIAITSRKPQTTRHALMGIYTDQETQIVFIDTPGIHSDAKKAINRQMNRAAWQSMDYVDAVIQVSEVGHWTEDDQRVADGIAKLAIPKIQVINKIDKLKDPSTLLPELEKMFARGEWTAIVPVSAQKSQNLDSLLTTLTAQLPEQPWIFPEDQITTAGMRFMAAEVVREKLFRYLHQEVPYELGVIIERYQEDDNIVFIDATIMVERDSQKGIIIGKGGQTLKAVGKSAREDLEKILGKKVMLKTFVKVKNNWRDNDQIIQSMGHGNDTTID
ncbi:GTPase Era [Suttonella ornithocola]|uniref:GTPase Era n=1 Tax=Suttonella ornithocola TaxID=279832 RepID=A0A380MU74_9GAMM|nr:GTPase Era [Suttonella ornithocola]SUO95596.1 GTPase Era [Suttonella ornithocola]